MCSRATADHQFIIFFPRVPSGLCVCLSFSYLLERVKDIIICHPNSLKPWYGRLGQLFVPHNPCTQRWEVMFVKMCAEPT